LRGEGREGRPERNRLDYNSQILVSKQANAMSKIVQAVKL